MSRVCKVECSFFFYDFNMLIQCVFIFTESIDENRYKQLLLYEKFSEILLLFMRNSRYMKIDLQNKRLQSNEQVLKNYNVF